MDRKECYRLTHPHSLSKIYGYATAGTGMCVNNLPRVVRPI